MAMLTRASHAAVFLHVVMTMRGASLFIGWRMKRLRFGTMPQPASHSMSDPIHFRGLARSAVRTCAIVSPEAVTVCDQASAG